jgi:hypothetical protein
VATYDNDLRLKEITTGDEDGTWGDSTNTNLELIADGFSYGTKEMAADANETFTMPDFSADATRSLYLKITSAVSLTATREVTLGPNTVSKTWIIENATSGSQIITIKQGSGATVNVPNGSKVMVVTDGAGAGAAVFNANPTEVGGTVTSIDVSGGTTGLTTSGGPVTTSGTITLAGTLAVANGGTGVTSSTGTGSVVLSNSPTFTGTVTADGLVVNGAAVFNEGGGDNDFRVESDTNTHALFLEGSSGNVGIGTSSPTAPLSVLNAASTATTVQIGSSTLTHNTGIYLRTTSVAGISWGSGGDLAFYGGGAGTTERMRIDSSGALLIHPNSPTRGLKITSTQTVAVGDTETYNAIGAGYGQHIFQTDSIERLRIANNGDISFYEDTGTTPKFFWDASAESLGIGTSSPTAVTNYSALTLSGAYGGIIDLNNGSTNDLRILSQSTQSFIGTTSATPLIFRTAATERMRINSSGNVGIGTSTIPTGVLLGRQLVASSSTGAEIIAFREDSSVDVGNIAGAFLIGNSDTDGVEDHFVGMWGKVSSTNGSQNLHFAAGRSGYEGDAPQMTIDSSGNVGIGTSSPIEFSSVQAGLTLSGISGSFPTRAGVLSFISQDTTSTECHIHARDAYMAFETGTSATSAERMRITSSGNVGIGVVPSAWSSTFKVLQLANGTSLSNNGQTSYYQLGANNYFDGTNYRYLASNFAAIHRFSNLGAYEWLTASSGTAGNTISFTQAMTLDASGNLGIGTTSPTGFSGYTSLDINNATNGAIIDLSQGDVMKGRLIATASTMAIETSSSVPIIFQPAGSEAMRIDSSGNVGIGTSSPAAFTGFTANRKTLQIVNTTSGNGQLRLGTDAGLMVDHDGGGTTASTIRNLYGATNAAASLALQSGIITLGTGTSYTERMRIDASGNVGIGTASPTSELTINGGATSTDVRLQNTNSGSGAGNGLDIGLGSVGDNGYIYLYENGYFYFATNATERMRIDASGNLLVGRTSTITFSTNTTDGIVLSPSRIDISAASLCRISQLRDSTGTYDRFYNGASIVGSITGTTSATAYNTSSDQRLKENIADAEDAGSKVDAIKVRQFDWKADGSHQDYGMVAQELVTVAPEAVSVPEDPEEMMGVDYSKLVPMLIKEIQSLRNRVATLEGN